MIKTDSYGTILPDTPFMAQITKDGHMQCCDLYPCKTYLLLEKCPRKDQIRVSGQTDWLPLSFDFKLITNFDQIKTKICKGGCAPKVFPIETVFDEDGKCKRCASRKTRVHD